MSNADSHYDKWIARLTEQGASHERATISVIHRYLDGRASTNTSPAQRNAAFWTSEFWTNCTDAVFRTEAFALALAKYLSREGSHEFVELRRALTVAPVACKRAIRYSRVFLNPTSDLRSGMAPSYEYTAKGRPTTESQA